MAEMNGPSIRRHEKFKSLQTHIGPPRHELAIKLALSFDGST
jgi:hypothetical protein